MEQNETKIKPITTLGGNLGEQHLQEGVEIDVIACSGVLAAVFEAAIGSEDESTSLL